MGFKAKGGTLTQPGSTGTQAISGCGFTPKVVLMWCTDQTAAGTAANAIFALGASSAPSVKQAVNVASEDNVATTVTRRDGTAVRMIHLRSTAGTIIGSANLDSLGADGFTLDWVTVDGTSRLWHWLALGGEELEVDIDDFAKSTGAAPDTQAVTGVGFRPDVLILFTTDTINDASDAQIGIGFAAANGEQAGAASMGNAQAAASTRHKLLAKALTMLYPTVNSTLFEGGVDSFDADGFTITWSTNDATAHRIRYIALKGLRGFVEQTASPSSGTPPVAQSVTGVGFAPKAVLFLTAHDSAGTSIGGHGSLSLGVAVSSSDQRCAGFFDEHAADPTNAVQDHDDDACLSIFNASGSIDAVGELDAMTQDGFDLSWTTLTVAETAFAFLALGDPFYWPGRESHAFEIPQDDRPGLREFGYEAVGPDQYVEALKETYSGEASTLYRIADDDLVRREIFKTDAASPTEPADPDPANDAAWATYTSSPHTTGALTVSKITKLLVCTRNKYNLLSMNRTPRRFELDGSGNLVANSPSAPFEVSIAAAAGGTFLIEAHYNHLADGSDAADTFLVYLTTGGGTPDPTVDIPVEVTMAKREGAAHLSYTSGAVAHGVVGKVIVRTRKQGTPDVDSRNLDVYTATASTAGPAGDAGGAFFGAVAEQHD